MKHKVTNALFEYWDALRMGRPAPLRSEIEPGDIKRILPHIFILERQNEDTYRFRLAGTGLCNAYGMEFRNHNLLSMWQKECVADIRDALSAVTVSGRVGIAEYTATTVDGREATFEMILLPLAQGHGAETRILGAAVPMEDFPWIGDHQFARQWIDRLQVIEPGLVTRRERAVETARRQVRHRPHLPPASIASLALGRAPYRSERTYLRLVKAALGSND